MRAARISRVLWTILLLFIVVLFCPLAAGKVIYVDDDANGENDGSSWQNAYIYFQDALHDANESKKHSLNLSNRPVEIRVAQGIYKPDQGVGQTPGDPNATFQLINGIMLKGGYAGIGEPDPDARNAELYKTILNGDLADNDIPINSPLFLSNNPRFLYDDQSRTDNSLRILTATSVDPNTMLDGLTITGAPLYYPEDYVSAGLYIGSNANIIVRKCVFISNAANGIYCFASDPNVVDCVFKSNLRSGMNIYNGSPKVIRCTFEDNWGVNGGGINFMRNRLWLEECTFIRNVACGLRCADAGFGGGLCVNSFSEDSKIVDCRFIENIASAGGGAQIGYAGMAPSSRPDETILLSGSTFISNQAISGGAISQNRSYLDIYNCVFRENSAVLYRTRGKGGAISTSDSITNLDNCIFSGNYALERGASLYTRGGRGVGPRGVWMIFDFALTLNNCTFRGNISPIGRVLSCNSNETEDLDSTFITNCILDNGSNEIHNPDGSGLTISYTNLRGGIDTIYDPCEALIWSDGNIDADPLFADPGCWTNLDDPNTVTIQWDPNWEPNEPNAVWTDGNYHLKSQAGRWDPNSQTWVRDDVTSPCIDAGDPNGIVGDEPEPNGGRINMGAYGGTAEASKSP